MEEAGQSLHPHASPLSAQDFHGLPETLIISAEFDALRVEAREYAARLRQAGIPVTYMCYPGMLHNFVVLAGIFDRAADAVDEVVKFLRAT